MTSVSGISPLSSVRVLQGSNQTIAKVDAATAGTVYSYTLPSGTRRFSIVADKACLLKYGTSEAAILAGDFWPISAGAEYSEQFLNLNSTTIFFTSDEDADTIRINSWA